MTGPAVRTRWRGAVIAGGLAACATLAVSGCAGNGSGHGTATPAARATPAGKATALATMTGSGTGRGNASPAAQATGTGTGTGQANPTPSGTGTGQGTGTSRGSGSSGAPVVVRDGAGSHAVTITAGQRLEVILDSTYWNMSGSSNSSVLSQDGPVSELPKPSGCVSIPGLGCTPIRADFSALSPGTAVITASRRSCGEAMLCSPGQRNYTLTVTVRAQH